MKCQDAKDKAAPDHDFGFLLGVQQEVQQPTESLPGRFDLCQPEQKTQTAQPEFNDEFVPGTMCKETLDSILSSFHKDPKCFLTFSMKFVITEKHR